ncbi:MAG TPA: Smr/MutS family protein [Opitutales bacterium]|jgi:DNA-nicking Smr family endonuclease|nr:Smr/MutS family protein [Opitutales bacterium]
MSAEGEKPHPMPLEGTLDLHTFRPQDASDVLMAFLEESHAHGWHEVRIVHGKGIGTLRDLVHAKLRQSPLVVSYRLGNETSGGWGATIVVLKSAPTPRIPDAG